MKEARCYAPPGHFYSPIVDPTDEQVRRAVEVEAAPQMDAESVGFDPSDTLRWLAVIADVYKEMPFPAIPPPQATPGGGGISTPTRTSRWQMRWPFSQ